MFLIFTISIIAIFVFAVGFTGYSKDKGCREAAPPEVSKIKKLSADVDGYGLYKYEDDEVVCYIARATQSVSLQCFQKNK